MWDTIIPFFFIGVTTNAGLASIRAWMSVMDLEIWYQAVVVHRIRTSAPFVNTASYRTGNLEFWPGHDQIEQFDSGVEVDCGSQ